MGSHTYSTGGVTWCLSLKPCRSEASQGHCHGTPMGHPGFSIWLGSDGVGSNPCLFGAREKPRLEARAPLPTFCLQKVLWEPRWDSQDMVPNIHGIKTNNFKSIIRKKNLKTLGISSNHLQKRWRSYICIWPISLTSYRSSFFLSLFSRLCLVHFQPYTLHSAEWLPCTLIFIVSPFTKMPLDHCMGQESRNNDRTTLCQRDKSQATQTICKPWTFPLVSSHTDAILAKYTLRGFALST